MKRIVLAVLVLEALALGAMVVAARGEGNDPAGRGLATVYLLAFAAPVALAAIAYLAGYWRIAGGLTLVLPVAIAVLWFNRGSGSRGADAAASVSRPNDAASAAAGASDWFDEPRVAVLLNALAANDSGALEQFRGQDAVLNAISKDGSRTLLTYVAPRYPGSIGMLVSIGADRDLAPPHGMPPVLAALDEDPMVLRQLLMAGARADVELRPQQPALQQAIIRGKRMHALLLVDRVTSVETTDDLGRSALLAAVEYRDWPVALRLLERGANPTRAAKDGKTVASMLADPSLATWRDNADFQQLLAELKRRGVTIGPTP